MISGSGRSGANAMIGAAAAQSFATTAISYEADPPSMSELADRVGELKAAEADLKAYIARMKALFEASGEDQAEGVLFRIVLGAESVSTTLDRKAIEDAMGEILDQKVLKVQQAEPHVLMLFSDCKIETRSRNVTMHTVTPFTLGSRVQIRPWAPRHANVEGELVKIGRKFVTVKLDTGETVRRLHPTSLLRPGSHLSPGRG